MWIQKYISQKKELQNKLGEFLENPNATDQEIEMLTNFIVEHKYKENREELEYFLQLL